MSVVQFDAGDDGRFSQTMARGSKVQRCPACTVGGVFGRRWTGTRPDGRERHLHLFGCDIRHGWTPPAASPGPGSSESKTSGSSPFDGNGSLTEVTKVPCERDAGR